MRKILALLFAMNFTWLFAQNYEEDLERVEIWLNRTYKPGSLSYESVKKKLRAIFDSSKSEKEKIAELHQKFPKAFVAQKTKDLGKKKDFSIVVSQYRKAAEQGDAEAQLKIALGYDNGIGIEKDLSKAFEWYRKAAEQGHPKAQLHLAFCYKDGKGVEKNLSKAVFWFSKAAEKGNPNAQFQLAFCYYTGAGVKKNHSKAVFWFRKAAEQDLSVAQIGLALCYKGGKGVEKDLPKAVFWFSKAAERGDLDAQFNLALCYKKGEGVEKDLSKAIFWYNKAAEQGHLDAQFNLALCYYNGKGLEKDLSKAVFWFSKAAEQGYPAAQYNLALCYHNGEGVDKSLSKAISWYRKAAEQGNVEAKKALKRLLDMESKTGTVENWSVLHISNHPKAVGLYFSIKHPSSWLISEGNRPHVVKKLTKGTRTFVILAQKTPYTVSAKEADTMFSQDDIKEMMPKDAKLIRCKKTKLEGQSTWIMLYSQKQKRLGVEINMVTIACTMLYRNYMLQLMSSTVFDPKEFANNAISQKTKNKYNAFFSESMKMFNSLVIYNRYQ